MIRNPSSTLRTNDREVPVGNLNRVLYPETGTTKAELIQYFVAVAEAILPYLEERPLSLRRFPEGVGSQGFWQKRCPSNRPGWMQTTCVEGSTGTVDHCLANDLPSLLWLVGQGTIELHANLHRRYRKRPDLLLFDLDPGPGRNLLDCVALSLGLRDLLGSRGISSFPKSSGKKGLHVMVPLGGTTDYPQAKEFASFVAHELEGRWPELVTANMRRRDRKGKIFIDWSQNDRHKTTVCPLSPRASARPAVSTPLFWEELEFALAKGDPSGLVADISTMPDRLPESVDIMGTVLATRQSSTLFHTS